MFDIVLSGWLIRCLTVFSLLGVDDKAIKFMPFLFNGQHPDKLLPSFSWLIMVFNATFNNISAISWQSVLLVEETGQNNGPVTDKLSHNVVLITPRLNGIRIHVSGDRY
jgi:hypothetical protein